MHSAKRRVRSLRRQRRTLIVLLFVLASLATFAALVAQRSTHHTVLQLGWESGTNSDFTNLECPHPDTQFAIVNSPVREGTYAARFSETKDDVWSNGSVRCLDGRYDTNETTGDDYWFGLSILIPNAGFSDNLVWELHQPKSLYMIPGCGIAPFAILVQRGRLIFRASGGDCRVGTGFKYFKPNLPLRNVSPYRPQTWIDFVVHIKFRESPTGSVDVWSRFASQPWTLRPQISLRNVPTMPYASKYNVYRVKLYTEMGLYPGSTHYAGNDTIYLDGYRRGSSFADVAAPNTG